MDDFAIQLGTTDTKKKISVGQDIIDYLGQPDNPADCEDLGAFIDALVPWMTSSNFKVRKLKTSIRIHNSWNQNAIWRKKLDFFLVKMNHLIRYASFVITSTLKLSKLWI